MVLRYRIQRLCSEEGAAPQEVVGSVSDSVRISLEQRGRFFMAEEKKKGRHTLNMEERTLVSHILDAARKVLSTPMNIPSVEQVELRADAPIGSQQMILLYLELFLVTVLQNDAKPDVFPRRRITGTFVSPVELSGTREKRLQEITEFMEFRWISCVSIFR